MSWLVSTETNTNAPNPSIDSNAGIGIRPVLVQQNWRFGLFVFRKFPTLFTRVSAAYR